ncbi:MAG TPA: HAMP domain-containing protein, partial [Verrucomicrobiae bacterium]|nr:HAMP domain-containing protein [Verrucomicrobiae bacterium]
MGRLRKLLSVSFRAKVLVPVIFVMICLLGITAWVVNRSITEQYEAEAKRTLASADQSFTYWQRNRAKTLILRVRDLRNEPHFKATLSPKDPATVRHALPDLLRAAGEDVKIVFFINNRGGLIDSASRDELLSATDFAAASSNAVNYALRGEDHLDTIHVGEKLYDIVSIAVSDVEGNQAGALTFGMEISRDEAVEIGGFTRSEIVLLADNEVVFSTLSSSDANRRLVTIFKELSASSPGSPHGLNVTKAVVFDGQHYYCASRRFSASASSLGILLLHSYEKSWESLQKTQQILIAANAIAILLGSLLVCFLVGRVTQPLRDLRDTAEAVGRGDFSRRVEVRYEDECGELARVFNQMTHNIKQSRETLESTVETLKTTQAQLIQSEKLSGIGE